MAGEPGGRAICLQTHFARGRLDVSHQIVEGMRSR